MKAILPLILLALHILHADVVDVYFGTGGGEAKGIYRASLDTKKGKCRAWSVRPLSCRMHHILPPTERAHPQHDAHDRVDVRNIRIPIRKQAALQQLDKRMSLGLAPFMYAGVLQLLELAQGELIPETGEAVQRMGQDGRVQQRANRNVKHAKKFKGKGKGRRK